jgi:hypothetical protein
MQGEAFPKNTTLEASCMVYAEFWFERRVFSMS